MNIQPVVVPPSPLPLSALHALPEWVISSVLVGLLNVDDAKLAWLIVAKVEH